MNTEPTPPEDYNFVQAGLLRGAALAMKLDLMKRIAERWRETHPEDAETHWGADGGR